MKAGCNDWTSNIRKPPQLVTKSNIAYFVSASRYIHCYFIKCDATDIVLALLALAVNFLCHLPGMCYYHVWGKHQCLGDSVLSMTNTAT